MRALLLVTIACGACAPAPTKPAPAAPAEARDVRVGIAEPTPWPFVLRATGETRSAESATLAAKVAGRVAEVTIDLGSRVKKGDVIARIETLDLELRVAQSESALIAARTLLGLPAEGDESTYDVEGVPGVRSARAELDDAQRERDRFVELSKAGVATQSDLDSANARLATAEADIDDARQEASNRRAIVDQRRADLALARQAVTDAAIAAPFDGVVATRLVNHGDYLGIGAPVARLVRFDPLRVRVDVSERDAHLVRIGQTARIEIAGLETPRDATVTRTAPNLAEGSRTLAVEFDLPNADLALRPGAFAAAIVTVDPTRAGLSIPAAAMVSFAGIDKVFVVEGTVAKERRIQVGRRDAERIEVVSGLDAGARVVLSPGNLRGGTTVRIAQ